MCSNCIYLWHSFSQSWFTTLLSIHFVLCASESHVNISYCCLLRRFNHNYYASNHQIAEDHFPIFVRRFIQIAKVTVRRPKLLMNKMPPFKKVYHKMWVLPGLDLGTLCMIAGCGFNWANVTYWQYACTFASIYLTNLCSMFSKLICFV